MLAQRLKEWKVEPGSRWLLPVLLCGTRQPDFTNGRTNAAHLKTPKETRITGQHRKLTANICMRVLICMMGIKCSIPVPAWERVQNRKVPVQIPILKYYTTGLTDMSTRWEVHASMAEKRLHLKYSSELCPFPVSIYSRDWSMYFNEFTEDLNNSRYIKAIIKSSSISVFVPCDLVFIVLLWSLEEIKQSFDVTLLLPLSEPSGIWRNQTGSHVANQQHCTSLAQNKGTLINICSVVSDKDMSAHEENQKRIFSLLFWFEQAETRGQQQVSKVDHQRGAVNGTDTAADCPSIYLKAFKYIQIYLQQLCGQADANFASVCICPPKTLGLYCDGSTSQFIEIIKESAAMDRLDPHIYIFPPPPLHQRCNFLQIWLACSKHIMPLTHASPHQS